MIRLKIGSEKPRRVSLYHPRFIQEAAAIICLILILGLYRSTALNSFSSAYIGGAEQDAGLYLWLVKTNIENFGLWWDQFANNFISFALSDNDQPLSIPLWFDTKALYPYGSTLAFSDNFILPSLFIGLLSKLGLGFVASWNALILGANLLNGYLCFRLCCRISGSYLSAILSGIAFMTWSWFGEHLGHPQLQFAFFIPLTFLAFCSYLKDLSHRKSVLMFLCIAAAFLTTVYYAVFLALLLGLILGAAFLANAQLRNLKYISSLIVGATLIGMILCPFVLPYLSVQEAFGQRHLYEPYAFAATGASYFSAPVFNWIYGGISSKLSHIEAHLFPGVLLLCTFVVFLWNQSKGRDNRTLALLLLLEISILGLTLSIIKSDSAYQFPQMIFYLGCFVSWSTALTSLLWFLRHSKLKDHSINLSSLFVPVATIFYIISLGPLSEGDTRVIDFSLYTFLYQVFPGLGAARAIGRAGVFVAFALSMVLGFQLAKFRKLTLSVASVKLGALIVVLVENFNSVYPIDRAPSAPPIFDMLAQATAPQDAFAVIPYTLKVKPDTLQIESWSQHARINVNYMNWASSAKAKLLNGYSGQQTWFMREYPRKLLNFPDNRSLHALAVVANLEYIIVMPRLLESPRMANLENELSKFKASLDILGRDSDGNFLIRLHHLVPVNDGIEIIAPPDFGRKAELSFNIHAATRPEQIQSKIEVRNSENNAVIDTIDISMDGTIKTVTLWPAPLGSKVRPRRFKITVESNTADTAVRQSQPKLFISAPKFTIY